MEIIVKQFITKNLNNMKTITLATLAEATEQEVFDQVVNHLRKQGKQSFSKQGGCAYRGKEGLKCAAGCLISDKEYEEKWEETDWKTLVKFHFPKEWTYHSNLIQDLQDVHDTGIVVDNIQDVWEEGFKRVANTYNLTYKEQ